MNERTWRHKPGPKGPRNPEQVLADLPLEVIIDLTAPLEFEHLGERRVVGRRLAQALAVTIVTNTMGSVSRPTAAKYRAIVRAIPEGEIPTPIKGRRRSKFAAVAIGLATVLHPSPAVDRAPERVRSEVCVQVDITRKRRARRRRPMGEIFAELRSAA